MKSTKIKVSVSQDGLLPQESAELVTLEFPTIQKRLLRALGFERVDSKTFVGVLPVFVNLDDKGQEIEIELGVGMPEMRKKVMEILQSPIKVVTPAEDSRDTKTKKGKKKRSTSSRKTSKATRAKSIKTTSSRGRKAKSTSRSKSKKNRTSTKSKGKK